MKIIVPVCPNGISSTNIEMAHLFRQGTDSEQRVRIHRIEADCCMTFGADVCAGSGIVDFRIGIAETGKVDGVLCGAC